MTLNVEIPYGLYWSTPFVRWQGSFSHLHSIEFAAHVARQELARRGVQREQIDYGVLGMSVPQKHAFYGLPWLTGLAGLAQVGGPTIMQACATGVRVPLREIADVFLTSGRDSASSGRRKPCGARAAAHCHGANRPATARSLTAAAT